MVKHTKGGVGGKVGREGKKRGEAEKKEEKHSEEGQQRLFLLAPLLAMKCHHNNLFFFNYQNFYPDNHLQALSIFVKHVNK